MNALACTALLALSASSPAPAERWHRVVGLLEYLEGDYGNALATGDAAELEEQRGFADEVLQQLEAAGNEAGPYLGPAQELRQAIVEGRAADDVTRRCGELARRIGREQSLQQAPRDAPSLRTGAALYATHCASCHGPTGRADTEAARQLDPPPANFHDAARMATLTPYKALNTISFGLKGTAMAAFPSLDEAQRWALAFHLFTLRQPECVGEAPAATLHELATSTDAQLTAKYGADRLACLRRTIPQTREAPLAVARAGLDDALDRFARGDRDGARQAVVDAYLNGLEPVEPTLRARDPKLVAGLEAAFTRTRLAAQSGQHFEAEVLQTQLLLGRAERETSASSFWSVFFAALLILLREGFEAVVVVGALLAVLKKMGATAQARVVHVAWVSALATGAAAYVFGQRFFAGANREWLESVVALAAVGLLLYAALWLNARANMSRFMTELRGRMGEAIGAGSTAGLFFISFSSVGRESIETALFLQGLAADSSAGATWGALAGLGALLALIALVRRVGFRLPMKALFTVSTVVLFATAVMLLGKGLHGLQELGVLPLAPVPFVEVDALGLFPDALSLVPQLVLASSPLVWRLVQRLRGAGGVTTGPAPTAK
ncbi:MAG: cytochrome c/FTR1 family iron permease [Myxococcota bacterium]